MIKILMEFCEGGSLVVIRERVTKLGLAVEENVVGRLAEGVCHAFFVRCMFMLICDMTDIARAVVSRHQEACPPRHRTIQHTVDGGWGGQALRIW